MSGRALLAVDGGNSKTDAVLIGLDGAVLAARRGPGSNPDFLGVEGAIDVVGSVVDEARRAADADGRIQIGAFFLAGADQPDEMRELRDEIARRAWCDRVLVDNDALALLWAGSTAGVGVAVVVGAGINCIGRSEAGDTARFAALGDLTGEWGGGYDIGCAALGAGVRAEEGRGQATALGGAVAAHFGEASALDVALAIHRRRIPGRRLGELAATVFAAAVAGDAEAGAIVDHQADEVVRFAVAAVRRIGALEARVEVVLGGSVLAAAPARLVERVRAGVEEVAPQATVILCTRRPLVGAAVAALHEAGAAAGSIERLRAELVEARIEPLSGDGWHP